MIRKAKLEDIVQCVSLSNIKEFEINGETPDTTYLGQSLDKIFLVAEKEQQILGLIVGYPLTQEVVYLDLLAVHADARGKKIGQQLIESFREELREQGLKEYFLVAPTENEQTLNFYRKNGLVEGKQYTLFCEKI